MLTSEILTGNGLSDEGKAEARAQLERLLADAHFSHSKRFPPFLRFIVEQALAGNQDALKERTLGIEVFGKDATYDTAADPIVRVTAAEIRKRIALYYQEPHHASELRLALPPGSYVPQFHPPHGTSEPMAEPVAAVLDEPVAASVPERKRSGWRWAVAGFAAGVVLTGSVALWHGDARSPVERFWAPVLKSSDPVLVSIADQSQYTQIVLRDANDPTHEVPLSDNLNAVVLDDLTPVVKTAGILHAHGHPYRVLGEGATTLTDLRSGPDILVGAYDNAWTLRLLKPLRFHFANSADMTRFSIEDSAAKGPSAWVVDRAAQLSTNIYRDYAIVARFTDATTGRPTIVAAGIGRGGTIEAGEFLTDPALLQQLESVPGYADGKNVELVLSTQIIGGQPGSPKIEASYVW